MTRLNTHHYDAIIDLVLAMFFFAVSFVPGASLVFKYVLLVLSLMYMIFFNINAHKARKEDNK